MHNMHAKGVSRRKGPKLKAELGACMKDIEEGINRLSPGKTEAVRRFPQRLGAVLCGSGRAESSHITVVQLLLDKEANINAPVWTLWQRRSSDSI